MPRSPGMVAFVGVDLDIDDGCRELVMNLVALSEV